MLINLPSACDLGARSRFVIQLLANEVVIERVLSALGKSHTLLCQLPGGATLTR